MFDVLEEPMRGEEVEGVGAMRGGRDGEAEAIVAEKRGEAGEGVGEAVGMPDAAVEKLVLAGVRSAGREGQFEAGDRRGELEMVEMGDERAEQDLRRCRRLGKTDAMEVRRRGFEIELEFDVGGGAVGGSEPGAKSVQRAFEEENEWLAAVDGVLEIDGGNDGLGRPEKAQETAGFAVKQIMDGGDGRAEAFGEALTGKLGEIGQGAEAPLRENFQVPRAEFQMLEEREGESGEWVPGGGGMFPAGFGAAEDEDVAGGGEEGEKVGEVGGGGVGQMEGKAQSGDCGMRIADGGLKLPIGPLPAINPRSAIRDPHFSKDERVGSGEFEVGGEEFGELEEIAQGGGFGVGIAVEETESRAAGERAGGGKTGMDALAGGGAVAVSDDRRALIDG